MKFLSYFFMTALGVLLLCLSAHESHNRPNDSAWFSKLQKRGAVLTFLNPLATFEPSIISRGHAQYFGPVDELSSGQKRDLKLFIGGLKYSRLVIFVGILICSVNGLKVHKLTLPLWGLSLINVCYLFGLKNFEDELDRSIKNGKSI